jgi:hypothetical protein
LDPAPEDPYPDGWIHREDDRRSFWVEGCGIADFNGHTFQMGPRTERLATDMSQAPEIPAISPAARGISPMTMLAIGTRVRL